MNKDRLVYDCNVYLQAILNADGASGRCVDLALTDQVTLFLSPEVLQEIHELPQKKIGIERGLNDTLIGRFVDELLDHATVISAVPIRYVHPIDPDDSIYVNLAIAADAELVVSNDRHLLNLVNAGKPWSQGFRQQYPTIDVLQPIEYLGRRHQREQSLGRSR